MGIVITEQPAPLLTSADGIVRQSLKLDATDSNELVDTLLLAAQAELDGPLGWVGISIAEQSVELTASSFDTPPIRLLGGPIIGAPVVTYLASDGSTLTLDADSYVIGADGCLSLSDGSSWPTLPSQSNAVTITYDVGIDDGADPRIALMKTAITLHAKMTVSGDDPDTRRRAIEGLVRPMWVPTA